MIHEFHILDVFGEAPYSGNQLAVVLDAASLTPTQMQTIAAETNFSETTFVRSGRRPEDQAYRVRIFTPSEELPFAGHPTLGTAWLLRHREASRAAAESPPRPAPSRIVLALDVGLIPVDFERTGTEETATEIATGEHARELGWLTAPPSTFGPIVEAEVAAAALGLDPRDIDLSSPVQQVTGGPTFLLVPLRNGDALRRCRPQPAAFDALGARGLPPFVHAFCRETASRANDLAARFFFEANGLREDPATGSATGCLGHYLAEHQVLGSGGIDLRIEQGVQMGRPSLLRVQARLDGGERKVRVGGEVFPIARGEIGSPP